MQSMFRGARLLAELDLSGWNTSAVTNMNGMFSDTFSLRELNISGWNTGSVTNISFMFDGAASLTELDLSGWDTRAVTDMSAVFRFWGASSLLRLNLSGWDTRAVTNMGEMFRGATALREIIFGRNFISTGDSWWAPVLNWQNLRTNEIKTFTALWTYLQTARGFDDTWVWHIQPNSGYFGFTGTSHWVFDGNNTITLHGGNAFGVINPGDTFNALNPTQRAAVTTINIVGDITFSGWMRGAFSSFPDGFPNLTAINGIERINTANVINMNQVFHRASSLEALNIANWNTGSVTDMAWMFRGVASLTELNLSGWNTSAVTTMDSMFSGTDAGSSLTVLNLSGWDTRAVTVMNDMFFGTNSLHTITFGRNFVSRNNNSLPDNNWRNQRTGEIRTSAQLWEFLRNPRNHDDTWVRVQIVLPPMPTPTPTPPPTPTPTPPPVPGDVTGDGYITTADVEILRQYLAGLPVGNFNRSNADKNSDSSVNILDLTALRLYLAGQTVQSQ